ncbi:hypothetical protein GCM10009563_14490 [Subtercola frigoramans]
MAVRNEQPKQEAPDARGVTVAVLMVMPVLKFIVMTSPAPASFLMTVTVATVAVLMIVRVFVIVRVAVVVVVVVRALAIMVVFVFVFVRNFVIVLMFVRFATAARMLVTLRVPISWRGFMVLVLHCCAPAVVVCSWACWCCGWWCRGLSPRECSAWKIASVTSFDACSFSSR